MEGGGSYVNRAVVVSYIYRPWLGDRRGRQACRAQVEPEMRAARLAQPGWWAGAGQAGWQPEQAGRRSAPCEVAVVRGEACAWARGVQAQGAEAAVRRRCEAAGSAGQQSLGVTVEALYFW